jgi:hypothetical protein
LQRGIFLALFDSVISLENRFSTSVMAFGEPGSIIRHDIYIDTKLYSISCLSMQPRRQTISPPTFRPSSILNTLNTIHHDRDHVNSSPDEHQ